MTTVASARGPLGADRPYPARTEPLPRRLADVTPEWLTGLLDNRYPGIVVEGFTEIECRNSHTTKLRAELRLNEAGRASGIPTQVCLKANWSGMRTGEICEREARFYQLLGPQLSGPGLTSPIPAAYYADWDGDGFGNGIVVMDDLAATPGGFGTSGDHLGVDGVAAGLESLATIHGALWGDTRLDAAWLPESMGTENDTEQVILFWNYIRFNLADPAYQTVVPGWALESPERMQHLLDELSAYERSRPGPRGLVHGDAHQGNSFVRADGTRLWLDWQIVRRGSPLRDVSYFVVGSLTVDERRAADRDLVEHYRGCLVATGADGVPDSDDAWQQFLRWPAYGSQAWLGNINQWGQADGVEIVKRHFAALNDYNTVELLTQGQPIRRVFEPGGGAFRLPPELQRKLDDRLGRDARL